LKKSILRGVDAAATVGLKPFMRGLQNGNF